MTDTLTPEFLAEAQEIVDALGSGLIAAESEARKGEVDPGRVNTLFRHAHSLKGISGMFGLEQITRLAHALESVLDGMRLGRVHIDPTSLDVLFACVESFNAMLAAASAGEEVGAAGITELVARLEAVASGEEEAATTDPLRLAGLDDEVLSVLTEYEEHRLRENLRRGRSLFLLRTSFDLSNFDEGLAELDGAVKKLGEVVTKLPSSEATDPGTISFDIIVGSDASRAELSQAVADERVEVIALQGRAAPPAPPEEEEPAPSAREEEATSEPTLEDSASIRAVSQTVRVDIRRLDRLMNLVGELSLIRMALDGVSESVRRELGFAGPSADLHKASRNFERRLAELQSGIMEVRMVPLGNLFERMVRVGRKIARELGREARIEVSGETTELDKLIVEDLADPLMHLIRNAIDHGVEGPEERESMGKPREGLVRLAAAALGNHVVVEVSDDGRGIDADRILETAIGQGRITAERALELSRREAFNLLFLPGFSTAESVSEYSGRGVGMDVVKTNISKLSGIIEIDSSPGEGTRLTITLPITLAIIPTLIVTVASETYAVPLNNVLETLAFERENIRTIERREVITLRGATIPVVDLRRTFGLDVGDRPDLLYAVLIGVGDNRIGLVVDDLLGQQDIVIKSLGRRLRNVRGIAGATELGSQQTILVIDTVDLLNEMTSRDVVGWKAVG